jgi:RNA polymerase sigma factor (sigma-70 family)
VLEALKTMPSWNSAELSPEPPPSSALPQGPEVKAAAANRSVNPPSSVPASLDDARLLAGLRRGDEGAFETLYRRHVGPMHGFALRLTSKRAEAEDLTQEVFVRAWESRAAFQSLDHFVHWLRRVMVNSWINRLRKRKELELPTDADGIETTEIEAPPASAPGLRLDLASALASLSPRLRAVALLFDLYGFGHDEIGELLDMTAGASKVQLHRARRRLREMLQ